MSKAQKLAEPGDPKDLKKDEPDDWQVDDAMNTMLKAEEHKANPIMMKKVHAKLGKKKAAITSIQGLRDKKNQLATEGMPD